MQECRFKNTKSIAIDHLNMNSLKNKVTEVNELITNKIDICLILETKLDQSFPNQQFQMHGYQIFHRDRNKYSGRIVLYASISSNVLI